VLRSGGDLVAKVFDLVETDEHGLWVAIRTSGGGGGSIFTVRPEFYDPAKANATCNRSCDLQLFDF
jgi:hypothetical protein